ncbi:MAG: hypothetical protein ABJF10_19980, partial [Chthoniobacter sp.]
AAAATAEAGGRWAPMIKSSAKCLTTLQARAVKETTRLATLNPEYMRRSIQLAETARLNMTNGNAEAANAALKEATGLWKENELALRLSKPVVAPKAPTGTPEALSLLVVHPTVAATPPGATPGLPTPGPATPKASPTPKATPKPATPRPSAASTPVAAPVQKEEEDDRPFYMKLPGAIAIVVGLAVVLAGANIFLKIKKRKAEEAE